MELPELVVADAAAWRTWLLERHATSPGVRLVLARKGTSRPTSLGYDDALLEALCFGWIDGQLAGRDAATFLRRFTPRGPRSAWSKRNVVLVGELAAAGRMHPSGEDAVRRAEQDGRWQAAYAGQADAQVPDDLLDALAADPRARERFRTLTAADRYSVLYRIDAARRPDTRARRIERFVDLLARGEPVRPPRPG